jgi:PKD repeat protein
VINDVTFFPGSIFNVNLNGTAANTFDQLIVNGNVNLTGANLSGTASGFVTPVGTTLLVIDNQNFNAIGGKFTGLNEGATVTLSGRPFKISYVGGSFANDLTLTTLNAPPVFDTAPSAAPNPAVINTPITFFATAHDPDGAAVTYAWDFGDGTNGAGASFIHTYTNTGTFNATVTVSDGTLSVVGNVSVMVSPPLQLTTPPSATPNPVTAGTVAMLSAQASGGAGALTFAWDFGDGTSGSGATVAHTYTQAGNFNAILTVTDTANSSVSGFVIVVVNSPPGAVVLSSGPSAMPNPAAVGQSISFSATATGGTGTLTYVWNFGDGTSGSGANTFHAYSLSGGYTATVTVTDSANASARGSVMVSVTSMAVVGLGPDSDGDGFSDTFETFATTNALDAGSTPIGKSITTADVGALTITKAQIKLNFAKANMDSIACSGTLSVPQGFSPIGAVVFVDVGDVLKKFPLDKKGAAKAVHDSFKLSLKVKKGVVQANPSAKFSVKLSKRAFALTLAATSNLTNDDLKKVPRQVLFTLLLNDSVLQTQRSLLYTAKKGKSGMAK